MDMICLQKLAVDLPFFCFLGGFFLFSDWLIFCLGSLLCRFVGTLGFFSSDVVYNVSDIFSFWFWLTRDFSLDNDVPIHESSTGFDGDRPGWLVLYVWHFSLDTIFCDLTLRSSFQLVALRVENKMTHHLSWMLLWEELIFDKIWGGTDVRPPLEFHTSAKKKRHCFFCWQNLGWVALTSDHPLNFHTSARKKSAIVFFLFVL